MPTLNWIGKEKVINHHQDVPYKALKEIYTFNNKSSENMIIHGDNLEALKALLPKYEGKINFIYIDPPYNTGEENWIYNDNVNDPRILKWLGEVVGKEGEDLSRHDKWLCMMYPRLKLLHKLLSEDGVIFISIDDHENFNLRLILDEIFGKNNFCATYFWKRTETPPSLSYKVRKKLEYIVCYQKSDIPQRKFAQGYVDGGDAPLLNSGNPIGTLMFKKGTVHFNIDDGIYKSNSKMKIKLLNDVIVENGVNVNDFSASGNFKWSQQYLDNEINKGGYLLVKSNQFSIRYQKAEKSLKVPSNIIDTTVNVGTNEDAKKELRELGISGDISFDYAKPTSLIKYLIKMAFFEENNLVILDSFAGSGTTANAVLELNNEDNGNRKFIEIELMDYADTITAERAKRVIEGFGDYLGTGGDFSFYELGESIFNEDGTINPNIDLIDLKKYIYYTETQQELEHEIGPLLGQYNNTSYYLFYDKDESYCLNNKLLGEIKNKTEWYVIYADTCSLSEEFMKKYNIIFKKLPRDIIKY